MRYSPEQSGYGLGWHGTESEREWNKANQPGDSGLASETDALLAQDLV